jgi:hypothetical protein
MDELVEQLTKFGQSQSNSKNRHFDQKFLNFIPHDDSIFPTLTILNQKTAPIERNNNNIANCMTVLSSLASSYHYGPATTSTTLWDISKSYIAEFGKRLKNIQNLQRQQAEEIFFQKNNLFILEQKLKLQQEELQQKLSQNDPKSIEKIEFSTQNIETLRAIENMTQSPQQSSSPVYTILLAAITAIITGIIIVFSNSNSNQVQRQQQPQQQLQQQPQQLQQQQQQQFTSPRLARSGLHTQTPHTRQYYNYSEN